MFLRGRGRPSRWTSVHGFQFPTPLHQGVRSGSLRDTSRPPRVRRPLRQARLSQGGSPALATTPAREDARAGRLSIMSVAVIWRTDRRVGQGQDGPWCAGERGSPLLAPDDASEAMSRRAQRSGPERSVAIAEVDPTVWWGPRLGSQFDQLIADACASSTSNRDAPPTRARRDLAPRRERRDPVRRARIPL